MTSTGNEYIKFVRSLKTKKARDDTGLFLVEGAKMVSEALEYARESVVSLLVSDKYQKPINFEKDIYFVPQFIIESVSNQKTPEGILALIERKKLPYISKKLRCVVLDSLADPGNVGTILRTCQAFGFDKVYLYNYADCFSYKTLRASMGAVFKLEIIEIEDLERLYGDFEKQGIDLIAADLGGKNISELKLKGENFAVAIGSESHGVSQATIDHAKTLVKIPISKNCESLNAAVAAGIVLYQFTNN